MRISFDTNILSRRMVLTINGGNIRVNSSDDGLNATSNIVINSGYIYIDSEGDGIDSNLEANTLLNISTQAGKEIATISPIKSSSLVFYSSSKLTANTSYNISTGGSDNGKSANGIYSSSTYKAGSLLGTLTMNAKSVSYGQSMGGGFGGGGGGGRGGHKFR